MSVEARTARGSIVTGVLTEMLSQEDRRAVHELFEALSRRPEPTAAEIAALFVRLPASPEALELLVTLATERDYPGRELIIRTAVHLQALTAGFRSPEMATVPHVSGSRPIPSGAIPGPIDGVLMSSQPHPAKVEALMNAIRAGDKSALPVVRRLLPEEQNPFVLATMVSLMGHLGEPGDAPSIMRFLSNPDARVVANTLEALFSLKAQVASDVLVRFVETGDSRVRINALTLLASTDPDRVFAYLPRFLQSPDPGTRRGLAYLMGAMGSHARARELLAEMLLTEDNQQVLRVVVKNIKRHARPDRVVACLGPLTDVMTRSSGSKQTLVRAVITEVATSAGLTEAQVYEIAQKYQTVHRSAAVSAVRQAAPPPQPPVPPQQPVASPAEPPSRPENPFIEASGRPTGSTPSLNQKLSIDASKEMLPPIFERSLPNVRNAKAMLSQMGVIQGQVDGADPPPDQETSPSARQDEPEHRTGEGEGDEQEGPPDRRDDPVAPPPTAERPRGPLNTSRRTGRPTPGPTPVLAQPAQPGNRSKRTIAAVLVAVGLGGTALFAFLGRSPPSGDPSPSPSPSASTHAPPTPAASGSASALPTPSPSPSRKPSVAPPSEDWARMKPAARVARAIELHKARKTRWVIEPYVTGLEDDPELYKEQDDGLFDAALRSYAKAVANGSKKPVEFARLGFLHEFRGELKEAKEAYDQGLKIAAKGSKEASTLAEKQTKVEAKMKALADDLARQESEARRANLEAIRRGEHPTMTPGEYLDQGKMYLQNFQTNRSADDLAMAEAYLFGAVRKRSSSIDAHHFLGQALAARAALGDSPSRGRARIEFEAALRLNPDAATRARIEESLKSLSR